MKRQTFVAMIVFAWLCAATGAVRSEDRTFAAGSIIIPMDTTWQDRGMFKAFGLVYALLRADVPVMWVIKPSKSHGDVDFVASATERRNAAIVANHGYRGGPFVIDVAHAATALPVVDLWQAGHVTAVHVATTAFTGNMAKELVSAPTIAVFSDGNEDIAFGYLNAAGIPDSRGQAWPTKKVAGGIYPDHPDALNVPRVAGPTTTNHSDGALFDAEGNPVYCQIMTMHWAVSDVVNEVVAEMRSFLNHPTHLFAQCQAVNAIENSINGRFLTTAGFLIGSRPSAVTLMNSGYPFAQMDGAFATVGGSEASYSLPPGQSYKDDDIVMITASDSPPGVRDIWMTGYLDGACSIDSAYVFGGGSTSCTSGVGKVSYLGGHRYETKLPISSNPNSQGTRLFLNSLFEADCATREGQPYVTITKSGPAQGGPVVPYQIQVTNFGPGAILDVVVTDTLPVGAVVVDATSPRIVNAATGEVEWHVGNLGAGQAVTLEIELRFPQEGSYTNEADVTFGVGVNRRTLFAIPTVTHFDGDVDGDGCAPEIEAAQGTDPGRPDTDNDGFFDCADTCPILANPVQDLMRDPLNCGGCGDACDLPQAEAGCEGGDCVIARCLEGWSNVDGQTANGCEVPCTRVSGTDLTCNGIDDDCNGEVDDGFVPVACGVGACISYSTCVAGVFSACESRPPRIEGGFARATCDNGVDDDCDGRADVDDPACGIAACGNDADCNDGDDCTSERCEGDVCIFRDICGASSGGDVDAGSTSDAFGTGADGDSGSGAGDAEAPNDGAEGLDGFHEGDSAGPVPDVVDVVDVVDAEDGVGGQDTSTLNPDAVDSPDAVQSDVRPDEDAATAGADTATSTTTSDRSSGCAQGSPPAASGLLLFAFAWVLRGVRRKRA